MLFLAWLSVVTFVLVLVYKIAKVVSDPLNLRWEIYPVPHEEREKRDYGGSYMEEMDWVRRPRRSNPLPELMEIAREVIYLKRVREHNRYNLWPFSIAMHWGIYLLVVWVLLLGLDVIVGGLTGFMLFGQIARFVGPVACFLGAAGSLALAIKRASNRELALYTTPLDYFNLFFLFAIFAAGLAGWVSDPFFANHSRLYLQAVLTFTATSVPFAALLPFFLLELFLIYMPFSKIIHYVAKYFTFHSALWDDGFKVKGSPTDERLVRQLSYTVGWMGPHILPGKTWLEEVQITGPEERK